MAIDKNAVIKEAQKFTAKGQFDKAIAEWKKIAKESPNDANVFNTIGDLCLKKNSKPEAVEAYKKAADILAADGFTSKAIALYRKVLNIDPKKIEAHLALADLNAEKGLTGNALESYKIAADHYTQNKEKDKALGIYQKMADLNPSNIAFRIKLAEMYVKEGMKKEAINAFLQAANVHISKEAFNDARQLFEKALALDPNSKEVYQKAGLVYFKEGKFVEACKALKPAFESDQSNEEIADLYLDALSKAGRGAEAAEVYQKLLSQQPERNDLREKLYRLYLEQKDYDKAFAEVSSLANVKIESKDLDAAEEILKVFITEAPRHVDAKRALSAVYKAVGKVEEAASALVQAAEILINDGDRDSAKEALEKAIELAPDHDEAKRLMESLQPPERQSQPDLEIEEPEKPEPAQAPAVTRAAPPASPVALLEDPVIAEAFTEVDVLVKYGLATKAIEQLENLAKTNPKNLQIRIKLRDLYGDQGNMGKAVTHMFVLADLYREHGMEDKADEALRAAQVMDNNNAEARATLDMSEPVPAPAAPLDFAFEEPAKETPVFEESIPSLDPPVDFETGFDMAPGQIGEEMSDASPEMSRDLVLEEPVEAPSISEEISFEQPFSAPDIPAETPQSFGEEAFEPEQPAPAMESPAEEIDISEIWAEAEFYYQQGLFDEARKHYEKILEFAPGNTQANDRIAEILREQEEVQEFSKLADAVDGLEGLEAYSGAGTGNSTPDMAISASDDEAVRLLMQEIAQLKQKSTPPPREKAAPAPPKAAFGNEETRDMVPGRAKTRNKERPEEDFFDLGAELSQAGKINSIQEGDKQSSGDSDDFFDLASELRDELSSVLIPAQSSMSSEGQSLDDIFEEFKKGVEQQAIKEDTDTHYNLGVAYKEMGLLDDAIGEFTLTPEEEPKFVQSRHMLGLCYMEKGDYQNAIVDIQNALSYVESQGAPARDRIRMLYDLGLAFQGAGNSDSAINEFQKVHALDPGYRDAAEKIHELQQGGIISLEQLKDDIEREISSKFLEEGERIEREEKTRKNEKVRN